MVIDLKQCGSCHARAVVALRLATVFAAGCLLSASLLTGAAQTPQRVSLRGHVPAAVAGLAPVDRLPAATRLRLAISLPLRQEAALSQLLRDLYDPASPGYRQYLTPVQFAEKFSPSEADYQAVADFAEANGLGVTCRHPNRLVLDVEGNVADIERTFQVTLRVYPHPTEARTFFAPDREPSISQTLPILTVSGLDNFALPHPNLQVRPVGVPPGQSPNTGSGAGGSYMGKDFRAAYVPGTPLTGSGQSVGLVEFDGYYASDISAYESQAGLASVPQTVVPINGGIAAPGTNNIEVALDIEMVMSMAPGVSRIYVYESPFGSPWVDLLSRMANDNFARQFSCSWYGGGVDAASEAIFVQMAAQGQSFLNASGDSDAFVAPIPFPGDSTNITQVGGTTLSTAGPQGAYQSETVWNRGSGVGSSGGVSSYYGIPSYQRGLNMSANLGSTTRRNTPDVALTAENVYVTYDNGTAGSVGGTSVSAPLWAGFTALVNQLASSTGRPPVGFLNPALYALGQSADYASAFHDITAGDNTWTRSPGHYYAVPGYDLCTGWGTPKGTNLIYALAGALAPVPYSNSFTLVAESCTNGFIDPGETVTVDFGLKNFGAYSTTNLVATLQAGGGVIPLSGPQTIGALAPGSAAAPVPFTFIATGACGSSNTATLQLQDGTVTYPPVPFSFQLGKSSALTVAYQSFDGVIAPALPLGWTTSATNGESKWITSTNARDTGANSAFSLAPAAIGLNELDSPAIALPNAVAQLSFRQNYDLEAGYAGGVLEIEIGSSGVWSDILDAGGSFVSGGYVMALNSATGNPLSGRLAWTGTTGDFITTLVNLPSAAAGQSIHLRWRCGTGTGTSGAGWYVDTVRITGFSYSCCASAPVITVQPQSLTVSPGMPVTLFIDAEGTYPLACQWQLGGTNIPGANATNYTLPSVQYTDAGTYAVVVTNSLGSATSAPAILTVAGPPAVLVQPADQTVQLSSNATFTVVAGGQSLAYQWYFGPNPLAGQTNAALTLLQTSFADAGTYSVIITNTYGSATGGPAALTVVDTIPPTILACASNATLAVGANCQAVLPDFTAQVVAVDVSGPVSVVQNPPPGTLLPPGPANLTFTALDSSSNAATCTAVILVADLTPPAILFCVSNLTLEASSNCDYALPDLTGTNYFIAVDNCSSITVTQAPPAGSTLAFGTNWVVLSAVDGSGNASIRAVPVLVPTEPVITAQPMDVASLAGNTVGFAVSACGPGPLAYAWQHGGIPISGATGAALTLTNIGPASTGGYQVWVTNAAGVATSQVAALTLLPPNLVGLVPNLGLTNGGTFVSVLGAGFQNGAIVSFGGVDALSVFFLSPTNLVAIAPPLSAGMVDVVIINADGQPGALTNGFTYGVPPAILQQPTNQIVTAGGTATFQLVASGTAPLFYQWQLNGTNLTDAPTVTGSQSNVLVLSPVAAAQAGGYAATVYSPLGFAASTVAVLTVQTPPPAPVFQSVTPSGATIALTWSAIPGRTYQLQSITVPGQTNWANAGDPLVATNSTLTGSDSLGPDPQRFYRVILVP